MDVISKLPEEIIETILCYLPIQEATRTSILSKEWRYRWLKIFELAFIEDDFEVSTGGAELSVTEQKFVRPSKRKRMSKTCKLLHAAYQVLLIHQGPIHEFTLCTEILGGSCFEIDRIILHLSQINTVKKLKLDFNHESYEGYVLPATIFSLHKLTDLYLCDCALHESSINEFGCLTTLYLESLWTNKKTLLLLLSSCPLLKRLTLNCHGGTIVGDSEHYTIVDLFKCLTGIKYLSLSFYIVQCFAPDRLPKELPTTLIHLKNLCMEHVCFSHKYSLPFLVLLISSSPNLEKLKVKMYRPKSSLEEEEFGPFTLQDYSYITLENLNELEIVDFFGTENELDFVKLVLAKSSVLKKVKISTYLCFGEDNRSMVSENLLHSPCASPMVKIIIVKEWGK